MINFRLVGGKVNLSKILSENSKWVYDYCKFDWFDCGKVIKLKLKLWVFG